MMDARAANIAFDFEKELAIRQITEILRGMDTFFLLCLENRLRVSSQTMSLSIGGPVDTRMLSAAKPTSRRSAALAAFSLGAVE